MNTVVQPDFKVISPCERCIVRATCLQFCFKWINTCRKHFPIDEEISLEEFSNAMNLCGPMDNYFQVNYKYITSIKFPDHPRTKFLISVDRSDNAKGELHVKSESNTKSSSGR